MDQKTKEHVQEQDREGLLAFIEVLFKKAAEQKEKLKAEAEKWKAEAEKWQAEAERLARIAPPNPYEPPLLRMRGGRMNMSEAEVEEAVAAGDIVRVPRPIHAIDEDHGGRGAGP